MRIEKWTVRLTLIVSKSVKMRKHTHPTSAITKKLRNPHSLCRASSMPRQPPSCKPSISLPRHEEYAAEFHQSVVKPHTSSAVLPLPNHHALLHHEPHPDMGSTDRKKPTWKGVRPARACTVGWDSRPKRPWCNHLTEISCGHPMQNARPKASKRPIITYAKALMRWHTLFQIPTSTCHRRQALQNASR